jgi:hypothetical protein
MEKKRVNMPPPQNGLVLMLTDSEKEKGDPLC